MMIALLSILQMERGTFPASRIWINMRFASVIDIMPIESGVGPKN